MILYIKIFLKRKKKKITLRRKSDSYYDQVENEFQSINHINNFNNSINRTNRYLNISHIIDYELKEKNIDSTDDDDEFKDVMPQKKKR